VEFEEVDCQLQPSITISTTETSPALCTAVRSLFTVLSCSRDWSSYPSRATNRGREGSDFFFIASSDDDDSDDDGEIQEEECLLVVQVVMATTKERGRRRIGKKGGGEGRNKGSRELSSF
jgi:hypothetical protein